MKNSESAMTALIVWETILASNDESPLAKNVAATQGGVGIVSIRQSVVAFADNLETSYSAIESDSRDYISNELGCWDFEVVPFILDRLVDTFESNFVLESSVKDITAVIKTIISDLEAAAAQAA